MTEPEFNRWLEAHLQRFPSLTSWFAKFPVSGEAPTRHGIRKGWFDTLSDMDLRDCLAASKLIANGEEPEPKAADKHPTSVRLIAKRLRIERAGPSGQRHARWYEKEPTVRCLTCGDVGVVTVWHPVAVTAFREGRLHSEGKRDPETQEATVPPYTLAVPCRCEAGNRFAWMGRRYDEREHCRIHFGDGKVATHLADCVGVLREWCGARMAEGAERYVACEVGVEDLPEAPF